MRKFGLLGYPLGHSFSKKYFTEKFEKLSLFDCSYENFELTEISALPALVNSEKELDGLNVTIPYKSEVLDFIDSVDSEAAQVGAVNVLKMFRGKGQTTIKGFNTDVYGFRESLIPYIRTSETGGAIVLGTGGSSKAVCYVLKQMEIKFIQVSRKPGGSIIGYNDLSDKILSDNKIIINTTPLGMFPLTLEKPEINYSILTPGHILYDLIYNPELTAFLKSGLENGCTVINGSEMLRLQAEKSWEIWNNEKIIF